MEAINAKILSTIECPVCHEWMKKPIYNCNFGHSFCGSCVRMICKCPICNRSFGNARNWTLEQIVGLLYYPCTNTEIGCNEMLLSCDLEEHKLNCIYRIYECQIFEEERQRKCVWSGQRELLINHVVNIHEDNVITKSTLKKWDRSKSSNTDMFVYKDEIFWIHNKQTENYINWCVQYLGNEDYSSKYRYEVCVSDVEEARKFISIGGVVQPDTLHLDDIFDPKRCIKIFRQTFELFEDYNNDIWFLVEVLDNKTMSSNDSTAESETAITNCTNEDIEVDEDIN